MKLLTKKGETEKRDAIVKKRFNNLVRRMYSFAGVKVEVAGRENIPEGTVLFCANHQGLFDAGIMLAYMREPCGFVIKKEVEKIPLAASWLRYLGSVFIDRDSPRAAVEAINKAAENLKNGKSMVIFPEGTRSRTGEIGEFKNGAFKMAQKTGVPIVPVAISGTSDIWEREHKIRPGTVKVSVLSPVYTNAMTREEFKTLGYVVREMIVKEKMNLS